MKTKLFRVNIHLAKLQAKCNKVQCQAHAIARIEQNSLEFKEKPQLKNNMANFNSNLQFDCVKMIYNSMQGIYEDKQLIIIIELITQGVTVKIGQSHINIAKVLNTKKFSIPTSFPLIKCYDKAASIKISLQFQPINQSQFKKSNIQQVSQKHDKVIQSENYEQIRQFNSSSIGNSYEKQREFREKQRIDSNWGKNRVKQRIAEQENVLLYSKIQEYEDKMEKFRSSQQSISQKLHQQIWKKDQKLLQLQASLRKIGNTNSRLEGQLQQLKLNHSDLLEKYQNVKQKGISFQRANQQLKQENKILKGQIQGFKVQVESFKKNKETKDRHYKQQLQKYSSKFMASEHQKNLIILQMESRLKQEKQKCDRVNKQMSKANDARVAELNFANRQKQSKLETEIEQQTMAFQQLKRDLQRANSENKRLRQNHQSKEQQFFSLQNQYKDMQRKYQSAIQQLQMIPHTTAERDAQARKLRQQIRDKKERIQQQRTELSLANNTINQYTRKIAKLKGQIESAKNRQKQLSEMYQQQLQLKDVDAQFVRENSQAWQVEVTRLKGKLKLAQQKASEYEKKTSILDQSIHGMKMQMQKKKQIQLNLNQHNIMIQSENSHLKRQIEQAQEIIRQLKDQNQHLNRFLAYKNLPQTPNLDQTDKWSEKVDSLQRDIFSMMEKYKHQKHQIFLQHQQQLTKMRQQSQKRIKSMQNEMHELKMKNNDITTQNGQRTAQINSLNEKASSKNQQLIKIQAINNQLQAQKERLKSYLENNKSKLKELQRRLEQDQVKIGSQKSKSKNLKNAITRYLMGIVDKFSTNNPIQGFSDQQTYLQEELDRQVINYVTLGVKKYHDIKNQMQKKVINLQEQLSQSLSLIDKLKQQQINEKKKVLDKSEIKQLPRVPLNTCNMIEHLEIVERYEQYKRQFDLLTRQYIDLKSKLVFSNQQVQRYKDIYEQANQKFQKIRKQLEQTNEDLNISNSCLRKSREQVTKLTNDFRQAQRKLQLFEQQQKKAKVQHSDKKTNSQAVYLQKVLNQLQSKFAQQSTQLEQVSQLVNVERQKISNLNRKIAALESALKEKDIKISSQDQNLRYAQTQIDQFQSKVRQLNRQSKTVSKQKLVQLEEYKSQCQKLKDDKSSLQKEFSQLIKKNQSLNDSLKQYQYQHKKILEDKDKYIQQLLMKEESKQLEHQAAIRNWQESLVQQDKKRRTAQLQLEKLKNEVKNLNKKVQQYSKEINDMKSEVQAERQSRKRDKIHYDSYIETLKTTINDKQTDKEEMKFLLEAKIINLQKQVQSSRDRPITPIKYLSH